MLKLYRYFEDYGRMGCLEGLYVADSSAFEALKGKSAYGGELLGKHSDVYLNFYDCSEPVNDDQDFISKLTEVLGGNVISGYSPYDFEIEEEEE